MNLNEDLLIWSQASVNPCLSFKFFFLCIRKLVSRLLVEKTQSVVTWCRGGGGRFLPGNFLLGICRWMGRMFTAGLSIMEFHSHHSCGRTLLGDSG